MYIGLSGRAGSGKTWLANHAAGKYGMLAMSFATPLKEDLIRLGFPRDLVCSYKPDYMRKLLQAYGQAWRAVDPDWWLNKLLACVDCMYDGERRVIIDDMRFPNEADTIKSKGGYVFRLIHTDRHSLYPGCQDISETALDDYDDFDGYFVAGAGQTDLLAKQLHEALEVRGLV